MVCAGDVVGYGPDPAGAIRIMRERGIECAMGNHNAAVAGWRNTDGMIDSAREGTERHRRELGESDFNWLRSLPAVCECDGFAFPVVHRKVRRRLRRLAHEADGKEGRRW